MNLERRADAVVLSMQVMIPGTQSRMFCSALQFCQFYKMLLRVRKEEDYGSDGCKGVVTKEGEGKKKAVFYWNIPITPRCRLIA